MNELFDKLVDFEKEGERAPDGGGGYSETWQTVYANEPCYMRPAKSGRGQYLDKVEVAADFILYCRRLDITVHYRARCNGVTYAISFIENGSGRAHYMKVYLSEVKQ